MRTLIGTLALAALPAITEAQSCNAANPPPSTCTTANVVNPATITNPRTILLTMSATSTTATTTITDFDNAYAPFAGPTATINANRPWTLLISATTATWGNAGVGSRVGKPTSELGWGTVVTGPFTALTTTPVQIATGASTNSTVTSIFYRTTLNWTLDKPGVYTLTVTMTCTTP